MICQSIGKKRRAYYDLQSQWFVRDILVGSPTSDCFGRCGLGCGKGHRRVYTQQCLNHDLCHRETGQNLGVCAPYFMQAAPGFVFGTNCPSR